DAAVMGGFVYRGSAFPASYQGSYFFADYAQNWIKRLTFDGSGNLTGVFNFEPPDGSADGPYGDITKLIEGPDGSLYYVDIGFNDVHVPNEASIRRIRYLSNNQSPVAVADATPRSGPAPLSVAFSSAGSLDPEGQPITTTWTFGDNTTSTAANPTHVYSARGMYTARLQVSDGVNSTLSGAIGITAGTPPTAQITSPVNGILFRAGDLITYTGSGLDYLGNPLPPSAYSWTILFHHETHVHPSGGPFTGITTGSFTIPSTGHDFAGATNYEIVLTVTDSDGLSTSRSATIYPDKVNLSFSTQPSGLSIDVDGLRKSTPFVLDALKGFHNIINAPAQLAGGQAYDFTSWSDGGARSHEIVVPNTDSSWTATFTPTLIPDGLVAGYAFEEGAGTTTSDESGNGNDGALAGAVWTTQGRFGNALAFTGSNSKVTVPDSPSLQLASGMTLEAWVYPTAATGAWTDVIMKWNDDYYVTASSQPNGRPACGSRLSGSLYGTSALPVNAWSHLATTYDGAFVRLYVNGLEVGNRAATGTLPASGGPLSFGGDGLFGQYFTGRIDEVRIYDHALTPSEIQSDMSVSVITAAGEPAAAPPRRSAILGAAPNPFNPATRIRFRLGTAGRARLRIFDVAGRQVRSFDLGARAAGEHAVGWDGTSGSGARVASGVYVARLEAPDGRSTLRMVLLK
ncbi:MAG TPA: LamG-like jellyroll fold domain-containing protein, partial [Candidatus Eisenbacteria bacterium]|nr:LamG-like jellyroll fold domain-containing protein [Candidatus Eisenbacteria bacterium]